MFCPHQAEVRRGHSLNKNLLTVALLQLHKKCHEQSPNTGPDNCVSQSVSYISLSSFPDSLARTVIGGALGVEVGVSTRRRRRTCCHFMNVKKLILRC